MDEDFSECHIWEHDSVTYCGCGHVLGYPESGATGPSFTPAHMKLHLNGKRHRHWLNSRCPDMASEIIASKSRSSGQRTAKANQRVISQFFTTDASSPPPSSSPPGAPHPSSATQQPAHAPPSTPQCFCAQPAISTGNATCVDTTNPVAFR